MKYIDSEKLIAEIERQILNARSHDWHISEKYCEEILYFVYSLQQEQPDVDLDDVIENYILENFGERWDGCVPIGCFELDLMAEHFYRLGLNARKERESN